MSVVEPVLTFDDVSRRFRRGSEDVIALERASFRVHEGDFVVVTGPSGSGKSTMLHLAAGLDAPDSGTIRFRGTDLTKLSNAQRAAYRARHLGFVFQFFNLVETLSAVQNASLPLVVGGVEPKAADAAAAAMLSDLGLGDRLHHRPSELSGGQMQRVAVARALLPNPALVLADEPTGNLDSETGADVLALLRAATERGAAVIMVTHDPNCAEPGDRRVAINDGRLLIEV